jgi:hypothetical protein
MKAVTIQLLGKHFGIADPHNCRLQGLAIIETANFRLICTESAGG